MGIVLLAVLLSTMIGALSIILRNHADSYRPVLIPVRRMPTKDIRRSTDR